MKEKQIIDWLHAVTGKDAARTVDDKTGVSHSTVARARNSGVIQVENVIKIAKGYGVSPVGTLIELGYLDKTDANIITVAEALKNATDQELMAELCYRLNSDAAAWQDFLNVAENDSEEDKIDEESDSEAKPPLNADGTLNVKLAQRQGYTLVADNSEWEPEPGDPEYNNDES